jgi:hypothetical protein
MKLIYLPIVLLAISALTGKPQNTLGIEINTSWQNGAVSHYSNYEDAIHYRIRPYLGYAISKNWKAAVSINVENIRDEYVYPNRQYWGDEFREHRGYFEVAKIEYESEHFTAKIGRDFHKPGMRFYENLLFSDYQYGYDQLHLKLRNRYVEISSFYLDLLPMRYEGKYHLRHLNGHRIEVKLPYEYGYFAFNDVMVYGGIHQNIDWMSFNPLIFLYPYITNKQHIETATNTLMSAELYLTYQKWFLFTELLVDDYQVDRKVPGDLEPPEWGVNITLGKQKLLKNTNWKINYSRVANRTFNAPIHPYEKYLNKNYPVGHWLGNNFWEMKTSIRYATEPFFVELTLSHTEFGEEALYGEFNKDFMNASVEEGYDENFPFRFKGTQSGVQMAAEYNFPYHFTATLNSSYWFNHYLLKNNFNIQIGLSWVMEYGF